MKRIHFLSQFLLLLTLGASICFAWEPDPHVQARNKLIDASVDIIFEAERNIDWSCDPQYQDQLLKIHGQWIPYPPPTGKMADSTFWYGQFNKLAGTYSALDCFDSAIILDKAALKAGTHESEEAREGTRCAIEALKRDKREGYLSPGNPKHPRYGDESYDPYAEENEEWLCD